MIELIYNVIVVSIICTVLFLILTIIQKRWHLLSAKIHNFSLKYLLVFFTVPAFLISFVSVRAFTSYTIETIGHKDNPDIHEAITFPIESIKFREGDFITSILSIILIVWLIGMLISLYKLIRSKKTLKDISIEFTKSEKLDNTLEKVMNEYNSNRKVIIYETDRISSPCLTIIKKPIILFPKNSNLSDKQIEMLVKHEVNHLINNDLSCLSLINYLKIIYWFNPLMKYLENSFKLSSELTSDEKVIKDLSKKEIKEYGELLFHLTDINNEYSEGITIGFTQKDKSIILERIKNMKKNKKNKTKAIVSALLTIAFVFATPLSVYAGSEKINELMSKAYELKGEEVVSVDYESEIIIEDLDTSLEIIEKYSDQKSLITRGMNTINNTLSSNSMVKVATYDFKELVRISLASNDSKSFKVSACPSGSLTGCKVVYSSNNEIFESVSLSGKYDIWISNPNNSTNRITGSINLK